MSSHLLTRSRSGGALPAAPALGLAALSLAAAGIHLAVVPEHLEEWPAAGFFFLALGSFQGAWAVAYVVVPSSRLAWLGIVANLLTVALWAWSRTLGLPFAPEPGEVEAVGIPDLASTALELVLAFGLVTRMRGSAGGRSSTGADGRS